MACSFLPWLPPFLRIRNTERFKRYIRGAGLIDYWRGKGWPALCRPVGEDDFIFDTQSDIAPATPDSAGEVELLIRAGQARLPSRARCMSWCGLDRIRL